MAGNSEHCGREPAGGGASAPPPRGPTIGLLGDVMLGRGVGAQLATAAASPSELWEPELRALGRSCDLLVCNLECCISERGRRTGLVPGKRFFFRAPPAAVEVLQAIGAGVAGLANNHALDFGPEALADAVEWLDQAGIATAGAGPGPDRARAGTAVELGAARVGVLAVADHPREYAVAEGRWGIAFADLRAGLPTWLERELEHLASRCERVIAFLHWGPNMSTEPAAWQRRRALDLLAAGADLVAGHSAHVFHGIERIGSGLVLYDLGDVLDDYRVDSELRNDLGVMALWRPGGRPELELVGLRLEYAFTRLAAGSDADWIGRRLERACAALGTEVERVGEQRFAIAA